jgi:hypothetical protein
MEKDQNDFKKRSLTRLRVLLSTSALRIEETMELMEQTRALIRQSYPLDARDLKGMEPGSSS